MGFLKAIGTWLLGIFLGGIGKKIEDDKRRKAEKERDQALAREEAGSQNRQLEKDIESAKEEAGRKAEEERSSRAPDDPFGNRAWNKSRGE